MNQDEIKHGLLRVCKVAGWDSDFNVVGFHALCDKLKELGAIEEREACAEICYEWASHTDMHDGAQACFESIRARGQEC